MIMTTTITYLLQSLCFCTYVNSKFSLNFDLFIIVENKKNVLIFVMTNIEEFHTVAFFQYAMIIAFLMPALASMFGGM